MNTNRNLITFILATMALLYAYSWFTKKYVQHPPENKPVVINPIEEVTQPENTGTKVVEQIPTQVTSSQTTNSIPEPVLVDKQSRFTASNDYLELTWRQYDGALVQVVWKQDGTAFFPKEVRELTGKLSSAEFLGIGGVTEATFTNQPLVEEGENELAIIFSNNLGTRLTYRIPMDGYILDVELHSPNRSELYLIRALNDIPLATDISSGRQYPANPFAGLEAGRVFSIEGKKINAVAWNKILSDPWFKFLGRKRKELPTATQSVGLDAGVETNRRQTTHYFTAVWESAQPTKKDNGWFPGYHAIPDSGGDVLARLYLGPKQAEHLATFHPPGQPEKGKPYLLVMNFGFFGLIAKFLFLVLRFIQGIVPNWGWSLVILSLLVRLSLWTLNTKTTKGMLRQKELEPYTKQIQAKYAKFGNDMAKKQEMQRELMAFYKKNGHNPLGSCLPAMAQMPVFMALWSMLQAVFELRQAHWIFWITDLSRSDPFFILPAMMVATMIAQQAMTPPMGDPQQRKMMMVIMPVMMGFFFAYTPAGLTLYYLFFNLVGMGQTWFLMRQHKPQPIVV
ncbi:MAG: membrane protein insertase YidC [Holophagaceae bacterium]|nr:membrane protein insertase YidC [Holophagaceae bacterium]